MQKSETQLRRRRLSLPVAYLSNNRIVTYSCMLKRLRRKVLPRGTTLDTKFKDPVIFCILRKQRDRHWWSPWIIVRALLSFLSGSRITMLSVLNSKPAKLTVVPSSFFDSLIHSPTWVVSVSKAFLHWWSLLDSSGGKCYGVANTVGFRAKRTRDIRVNGL